MTIYNIYIYSANVIFEIHRASEIFMLINVFVIRKKKLKLKRN